MAFIVITNRNRFLQIEAALINTKQGRSIINCGSYYKSGKLLQTDAQQLALVFQNLGYQVCHYIERVTMVIAFDITKCCILFFQL